MNSILLRAQNAVGGSGGGTVAPLFSTAAVAHITELALDSLSHSHSLSLPFPPSCLVLLLLPRPPLLLLLLLFHGRRNALPHTLALVYCLGHSKVRLCGRRRRG